MAGSLRLTSNTTIYSVLVLSSDFTLSCRKTSASRSPTASHRVPNATRHYRVSFRCNSRPAKLAISFSGPSMTCCGPGHGARVDPQDPTTRRASPYPLSGAISVAARSDGAIVAAMGSRAVGRDAPARDDGVEDDLAVQIRKVFVTGWEGSVVSCKSNYGNVSCGKDLGI